MGLGLPAGRFGLRPHLCSVLGELGGRIPEKQELLLRSFNKQRMKCGKRDEYEEGI